MLGAYSYLPINTKRQAASSYCKLQREGYADNKELVVFQKSKSVSPKEHAVNELFNLASALKYIDCPLK